MAKKQSSTKQSSTKHRRLCTTLVNNLSPDLLTREWRDKATSTLSGHCYVASEAAWHVLGGMSSPWRPYVARCGDITHWWLQNGDKILDLTAAQFPCGFDYASGRKCGFLTKEPSRRARILLARSGFAIASST